MKQLRNSFCHPELDGVTEEMFIELGKNSRIGNMEQVMDLVEKVIPSLYQGTNGIADLSKSAFHRYLQKKNPLNSNE